MCVRQAIGRVCDWIMVHELCKSHPARTPGRTPEREVNMAEAEGSEQTSGGILQEIFTSPLNLTLLSLCLFLIYKIFRGDKQPEVVVAEERLPKLKKRDFTLAELRPYDGLENPRILMAVNGKVFDVTRGKKFYGPGNVHRDVALCFNRSTCSVPLGYDVIDGLPQSSRVFAVHVHGRELLLILLADG